MNRHAVDTILRGLKRFQKRVYPKHRELFHKLALGSGRMRFLLRAPIRASIPAC